MMSSIVEPETIQSLSAQSSPSKAVLSDVSRRGKRRNNHRKRRRDRVKDSQEPVAPEGGAESKPKRKRKGDPLQGMIVAVSTLDVKGRAHTDAQSSYKAISDLCRSLGASVTSQLHSRVTCLVCNQSAVQHATQRVRKALKRNVPLVDVAWVRRCHEEGTRIEHDEYCLNELAINVLKSRTIAVDTADDAIDLHDIPDSGWSEPTSLGCCCVCHENGDDKCPWCLECDVNKPNAQMQS